MIKKVSWLSRSYAGQLEMALVWSGVLEVKGGLWGVPAAMVTAFNALIATARTALDKQLDKSVRTPVTRAACNAAFTALVTQMRYIKNNYFQSPPRTAEELVTLLLKPHSTTYTKSTSPASRPEADLGYGPATLVFHFRDAGAMSRGKPDGVQRLEMAWDFRDDAAAIKSVGELTRHEDSTSSPLTITSAVGERGKKIAFCLRWAGPTGLKGKWSDIHTAIFP
jgi:hypothetical protein